MTYDRWKVGEWYKTRGGYEAQVLDVNYKGDSGSRIIGKIKIERVEICVTWMDDGSIYHHGERDPHKYDLMPPVERKELWVNVHPECAVIWGSKEDAEYLAGPGRIGLIRITIEGDDHTVEKVM